MEWQLRLGVTDKRIPYELISHSLSIRDSARRQNISVRQSKTNHTLTNRATFNRERYFFAPPSIRKVLANRSSSNCLK